MSNAMKLTRRKAIKVTDAQAGKKIFGTKHSASVSEKEFTELFVALSGGLRASQLTAVTTEIYNTMIQAFKLGGTVHVPKLGTFSLFGSGTQDPTAVDGGTPIELVAKLRMPTELKTTIKTQGVIGYTVVEQAQIIPMVTSVEDIASGSFNQTLTPGSQLDIRGTNLKFDNTKAAQGVYLIPTVSGGEIVKFGKSVPPKGTQLVMSVPAELVSGTTYQIEVRTCPHGTQDLRIGRYSPIFTVA